MQFIRMDEATDADFQVLKHVHEETLKNLPDGLFALLRTRMPRRAAGSR